MSSKRITFHSTILFLSIGFLALCLTVTTDENLKRLTDRCYDLDSCQGKRHQGDDLELVNCHCGKNCSTFGTCCMDSKHRTGNGLGTFPFKCMSPYGIRTLFENRPLFMLDSCKSDDADAQRLCLADGEALDDPFLLVPVTSRETGFTYKNYFCFVCNEDSEPVFWDLAIHNSVSRNIQVKLSDLHFNKESKTWTVSNMIVFLSMRIPHGMEQYDVRCEESVIQTCAEDWPHPDTRKECEAYMALVRFANPKGKGKTYRNPHCAACNYEDLSRTRCMPWIDQRGGGLNPFLGVFSLHDKIQSGKCSINKRYDTISKKCRNFVCGENQIKWRGGCKNKAESFWEQFFPADESRKDVR